MKLSHSQARALSIRRSAGLTLIEILVTTAISALLLTLAAPTFKPLLDRWRVQQAVGAVTTVMQLSRAEAIKRGGHIAIQKNPNNTDGCTIAVKKSDWGCGWQMFVDSDADGQLDPGEEILQSTQIPPGIQVEHSSGATTISVDRWGKMNGMGGQGFVVSPLGSVSSATRSVCISAGGRIRTTEKPSCQ